MLVTSSKTKGRVAIFLAAVLIATLVIVGVSSGLGHPSVPSGDVAIVEGVEGGVVTQEQLDSALTQAAAQGGLKEAPPPDDPQYQALLDQAMQSRLFVIWVRAEAADRGISVDDAEIDAELDRIKEQNFASVKEFDKYVEQSQLTDEDIRAQVESDLLQQELSKQVVPSNPDPAAPVFTQAELAEEYGVDDEAIENFYDANPDAFQVTASRDARVILNSSEDKVDQAKEALEADDSEESWAEVAAKFSQDQASKDRGGLLEGLVEGSGDPQLEEEVFSATQGELVGPFETDRGFYLVQVTKITDAGTQPLDEQTKTAIGQQLISSRQQQVGNEFRNDFIDKWTQRTTCLPEYAIQLCRNFTAPEPEPVAGQPAVSGAPVASTQPIEPGTVTITPDGTPQQGLPQAPFAGPAAAPVALPAGAVPVGPDGAPATGTVPPTDPAAAAAAAGAAGAAPPTSGAAPPTP